MDNIWQSTPCQGPVMQLPIALPVSLCFLTCTRTGAFLSTSKNIEMDVNFTTEMTNIGCGIEIKRY